jgi:GNAT superfamily N-acetyltransferase
MGEPERSLGTDIEVLRLPEAGAGGVTPQALTEQIDAIFFASSAVQRFANEAERQGFRERWLGRYLDLWPQDCFVACQSRRRVIGYLAGCLKDPATSPVFADIAYVASFADLSRRYPAHLHINMDPGWRSGGIGARLIEAFCTHASDTGVPGVHVVTGKASRNVRFYERCGFHHLRTTKSPWADVEIVCLGRALN